VTFRLAPEVRGTSQLEIRRSKTWRRKVVVALCCAGAFFFFTVLPPRAKAAELRPWTAQRTFSLPAFVGANVPLGVARGHIVLVHFFATWCESCREELPALNRLEARANGKVTVLAIAVADADQRVQRFFAAMPVKFTVLLDRDRAVAKAWGVATLPTTFVLDTDLRPRLVVESDFAWDTLDPGSLTVPSARDADTHTAIEETSNR
jgi:thiol-disulfide isomerase/thioredoxin